MGLKKIQGMTLLFKVIIYFSFNSYNDYVYKAFSTNSFYHMHTLFLSPLIKYKYHWLSLPCVPQRQLIWNCGLWSDSERPNSLHQDHSCNVMSDVLVITQHKSVALCNPVPTEKLTFKPFCDVTLIPKTATNWICFIRIISVPLHGLMTWWVRLRQKCMIPPLQSFRSCCLCSRQVMAHVLCKTYLMENITYKKLKSFNLMFRASHILSSIYLWNATKTILGKGDCCCRMPFVLRSP